MRGGKREEGEAEKTERRIWVLDEKEALKQKSLIQKGEAF